MTLDKVDGVLPAWAAWPLPQCVLLGRLSLPFARLPHHPESAQGARTRTLTPLLPPCHTDLPPQVLRKTYGGDLFKAGVFKLMWTVFVIMGAYFFTRSILTCIRTLEGKDVSIFDSEWKGWILAGCFFINAWLLGTSLQRMTFGCLQVGIRARAALTTAVANKCYSMAHLTKETAADAVGFVAQDISKIFEGIQEIHYLWCVQQMVHEDGY